MSKIKIKKIICEIGGKEEAIELDYEKCDFTVQNGYNYEPNGFYTEPIPNGQKRMIIRVWSGMEKFEDLVQGDRRNSKTP